MRFRRLAPIALALGFLLLLLISSGPQNAAGTATNRSMTLLDAPNGREVGWVHNPEALEVIERRDGWKRVRLEGWISESPGAAVRGHAASSQGTEVLLLRGSSSQGSWGGHVEAARAEVGPLEAETERLKRERGQALRIDNFSEATERYDELNKEYQAEVTELQEVRRKLLSALTVELHSQALNSTALDSDGNFEFYPPGPGPYSIFVPMSEAPEFPCCWKDVEVEAGDLWIELKPEEKAKKKKLRRKKN